MMAATMQASPVVSNVLLNLFRDGVHPNEAQDQRPLARASVAANKRL
jgi:hypothetical protein